MGNKYTEEEFLELASKNNLTVKIKGRYINLRTQILCYCTLHNYEWKGYPTSVLKGCGCKYCRSEKIKKTQALSNDEFIKRINSDIEPLEDYTNQHTKILVKSKLCGHSWRALSSNLMKGSGCPICSNRYVNNEMFLNKLSKVTNTIIPLEKYISTKSMILCRCSVCNNKFYTRPVKLLQHKGCPFCRISKGESFINKFLNDHNIKYERHKTFNDLRGIKNGKLSYDFYLPSYNLLIEYQGQFHDGTADIQTDLGFKIQQEHDKRKREYAKENNIELLEIWYWDFDEIEDILNEKINITDNKKSA